MKLSELKADVYRLAEVSTTKQLKAKYLEIKPLDLRYKAAWEKARSQLQQSAKVDSKRPLTQAGNASIGFEAWLNNPPSEYKALFTEAGAALASFGQKLDQTKKLTETAKAMVASLDEFAEATVEDAQKLISSD